MDGLLEDLIALVQRELAARADPAKAEPMRAYMRTEQPFLGVQKPDRAPTSRRMRAFPPHDRADWERRTLALWNLPHREERYTALDYLAMWRQYRTPDALPFCKRLITEGAWWDLVDPIVGSMISPILQAHRDRTRPVLDRWIDDEDLWVRRAAILSQLKHKGAADEGQLYSYCLRRAGDENFFIRKAIGWALRDHSRWRPESVREFLAEHDGQLSPLSRREAGKLLDKVG